MSPGTVSGWKMSDKLKAALHDARYTERIGEDTEIAWSSLVYAINAELDACREHYWHEGWRGGEMRARQGETDG